MSDVMRPVARFLTRQPVDGDRRAGPTFELYRFDRESRASAELRDLADDAADRHPDLDHLPDRLGGIGETR